MKILISMLILISFSISTCFGQKVFSEGILQYDVYMNGETKASGIYLITVKSGNIRREIAMNNGYSNITIFQHKTGKTYSLNLDTETKYALVLSPEELKEKNKRFINANIQASERSKKIVGYGCIHHTVTYTDGEKVTIFSTKELQPQDDNFNAMFPGLGGIPLEYEMKNIKNTMMKFVATQVNVKAIDPQLFEIPVDYKIVTKAELDKIK
jgi:hypothetical protein